MSLRREKILSKLQENAEFDVVVIGGGVNGIGVYRDLSLQGLRVLLVERNDFCSGCSAAPSRMIHGGLRYLENGEFSLVRESLQERDALLRNAPHMVQPLATVIPATSLFSGLLNSAAAFFGRKGKPSSRGLVPIKLGLALYDWVSRHRRQLPKHKVFSGRQTRTLWPALTQKTKYSAVYHDAWISHPERLCIELLRDVEASELDCIALNYAEIRSEESQLTLYDARSDRQIPIHTKTIVNASGAWLDDVVGQLGGPKIEPMVSGTKGSHLIIENSDLFQALDGHMVFFENTDGRVCIVFPYLGKVLAGSTDIRVERAERVRCEPEEQAYILESLSLVFPEINVAPKEVVFSYSGIRPLPKSDHDFTGRISRGHNVRRLEGVIPQFCMIGGKWTTFRAFAEQATDEVLAELGKMRKSSTLDLKIGGGVDFPADAQIVEAGLIKHFGISQDRATHLVSHYGTDASEVLEHCVKQDDDQPLGDGVPHTSAEMAYLIQNEYVETLSDLVLRRSSLAILGQIDEVIINQLVEVLRRETGLSEAELDAQKLSLVTELIDFYGLPESRRLHNKQERSTECV